MVPVRKTLVAAVSAPTSEPSLECLLSSLAEDEDEHVAGRVLARSEELDDFIIERGRSNGSQSEAVRTKMEATSIQRRFELGNAVSAIPKDFEHRIEPGQIVAVDVGVPGVLLQHCQSHRRFAEGPGADKFDRTLLMMDSLDAGRESFDAVHNQVLIVQRFGARNQAIRGNSSNRSIDQRRKEIEPNRGFGNVVAG